LKRAIILSVRSAEITKISSWTQGLSSVAARLDLKRLDKLQDLEEELIRSIESLLQRDVDKTELRRLAAKKQTKKLFDLNAVNDLPHRLLQANLDFHGLGEEIEEAAQECQLLQSLHFDNIWSRYDRITQAHTKTFTWIFDHRASERRELVSFVPWLRQEKGIFWIQGKAGSGKSTLMKFLAHHPDTTSHLRYWANDRKLIVAKFFFWNTGTRLQKSQEGLLRSLLFEVLRQSPELIPYIYAAREASKLEGTHAQGGNRSQRMISGQDFELKQLHWDPESLLRAFECLAQHEISANFCFFIDGLDEYKDEGNQNHQDLIKVLRILSSSPNIKICVSSRPWTVFLDAFGQDTQRTLRLEDLTREDIRCYVSDKFNEHEQYHRLKALDPGYTDIVEEVVRKAQGVFLWVFLVVRDLLEGLTYHDSIKTMQSRLTRFPEDLDDFFKHMINAIPKIYRSQTARTFQIAMSREEPLFLTTYILVDELDENPSLGLNEEFEPNTLLAKEEAIRRRLDGRCKGLVEIIGKHPLANDPSRFFKYKVDFLHRTVRDFLLFTPDIQGIMLDTEEDRAKTWILLCHATSLGIMTRPKERVSTLWNELFYFARLAYDSRFSTDAFIDHVLDTAVNYQRLSRAELRESKQAADLLELGLASQYSLVRYVRRKLPLSLGSGSYVTTVDSRCYFLSSVLRYALLANQTDGQTSPDIVEHLLDLGASPNKIWNQRTGETVFQIFLHQLQAKRSFRSAVPTSDLEVVRIFLQHGGDLSQASGDLSGENMTTSGDLIDQIFTRDQCFWLKSHIPEPSTDTDASTNTGVCNGEPLEPPIAVSDSISQPEKDSPCAIELESLHASKAKLRRSSRQQRSRKVLTGERSFDPQRFR
jgi:hypothetical protein